MHALLPITQVSGGLTAKHIGNRAESLEGFDPSGYPKVETEAGGRERKGRELRGVKNAAFLILIHLSFHSPLVQVPL